MAPVPHARIFSERNNYIIFMYFFYIIVKTSPEFETSISTKKWHINRNTFLKEVKAHHCSYYCSHYVKFEEIPQNEYC